MEGMIPDKRPVVRLVEQAHEGKLCLPAFQRDLYGGAMKWLMSSGQ
jgi:hypothetical protein